MTAYKEDRGYGSLLSRTKSRVGGKRRSWTTRDRINAALRLKSIYRFSPYIVALLLPGGLLLLPLIAWWRYHFGANRGSSRRR